MSDERPQLRLVTSPESFEAFVQRRSVALQRFAYLLCHDRDEARDLVQDAFAGAYSRWDALVRDGSPEAYLRRSIANGNISRWRKLGRTTPVDPEHLRGSVPDQADAVVDAELAWSLCRELPPAQRAAVVLRFYEDLDYAAISEILDIPETTARSHVHRALAALRLRVGGSTHG
ncbi:MAG: SigE family RNA polymerase sigma factor [Propionibacteriaceae bacterium]